MKTLVIIGSRADRNGLEVVHQALLKAGHDSLLCNVGYALREHLKASKSDIAVVGGDRSEILQAALDLSLRRIPIAHIAGGDVTEGSADDRYRDAITALSRIHFATNENAYLRLTQHLARHSDDKVYMTGSPAIDRIKQTPVLDRDSTWQAVGLQRMSKQVMLVCVHPNTVGSDPLADWVAVCKAMSRLELPCVILGANADDGGSKIDSLWRDWVAVHRENVFHENVSPQLYYSLMSHCDVMIGNSSAMLYEAPTLDCRCVLVGDRQKGRIIPENVTECEAEHHALIGAIRYALETPCWNCINPYGDGQSAPRIVKALEENSWRWPSKNSEMSHGYSATFV